MSSFYQYLGLLPEHWLAFMSAGPFLADRLITWFWPWGRKKLDALPRRRLIFIWLIVVGVFWSGFAAWNDEHQARVNAEQSASRSGASALSPPQTKLLRLLGKYQEQFSVHKLIVGRDGSLYFDGDQDKGKDVNFVRELFGKIDPIRLANFEDLMESMPPEYVRFFPEMRLDSPFVVGITEAGSTYLRSHP